MNKVNFCEKIRCDLCNSAEYRKLYSVPDVRLKVLDISYTVVECFNCKHCFLCPRPDHESIKHLYPDSYYANREDNSASQQNSYQKRTEYLSIVNSGKILDVGCAGGGWLKTLGDDWECFGTDFIESSYRENDISIKFGLLPDLDFGDIRFDVITAWGVMEHVENPSVYFETVHLLLNEKGIFIFLVPNADSLWSRYALREDIPRHLHFFRKRTIIQYARKYEFVIKQITFPNDIYSKPATGRGLFKRNLLLKTGVSWDKIISGEYGFFHKLIGYMGSILDVCIIHPWLEKLLGLSGNMLVILQKRSDIAAKK